MFEKIKEKLIYACTNKWILAALVLPFIKPATEFTGRFDVLFDMYKLLVCAFVFLVYAVIKKTPSLILTLITALQATYFLSTVINHGRIWWCAVQALSIVSLCALLELALSLNKKTALQGFAISLGLMAFLTVITMFVCYPNGLYVVETEHNIEGLWHIPEKGNYLWGFDNASVFKFMTTLIFLLLSVDIKKTWQKIVAISSVAVVFIAFFYVKAITAAAVLAILLIYCAVLFVRNKKLSIFNFKNCVIAVSIIAMILIGFNKNITPLQTIAQKTDKVVSLNYRFKMWTNSMKEIGENPLLGCGFEERMVTAEKVGMDHTHNIFLEIAYRGGTIGFIIFAAALVIIAKKQRKAYNTVFSNIIAVGFLMFLCAAQMDYYNDQYLPFLLFILAYHTERFLPQTQPLERKNEQTADVGILTFHNTVNYGAMLQTYALQKYISKNKVNCEVIDYRCPAIESVERPMRLFKIRSAKQLLKYFKCHGYQQNKWARFQAFLTGNVYLSQKSYTPENIRNTAEIYSAFIVGSDQVWNTEITDNDFTYFLDFVDDTKKKHSYAASIGSCDIPENAKETAIKYLEDFSSLNVREQQAQKFINAELCTDRTKVVADPTLLLTKDEWRTFVKEGELSDYIVVYMIDFKKEVFDFIRNLSKNTGCKIVYVHDSIRSQMGMINSRDDTVEDFITMINNARFVVTGSFHALCMSLKLEKQFYYTLSSTGNKNSRLENLIDIVGLSERRVTDGKCDASPIDYTVVTPKLEDHIKKSKDIINNLLDEIQKK